MSESIKKPYYRAVVLVLASHNTAHYAYCRNVWLQYYKKENTIKVFFVYGRNGLPVDQRIKETDIVCDDIEENYNPGMILKTQKAMRWIDENYTFDFFIRTNLSTFWDWNRLIPHLSSMPTKNLYGGFYIESGCGIYNSGTDTIVNGYMIKEFVKHSPSLSQPEDRAMGGIFHDILGGQFYSTKIWWLETFDSEAELEYQIQEAIKNDTDHYRVKYIKNEHKRPTIDRIAYQLLLKRIYNIDFS